MSEIFKAVVWDSLVKAAIARLFLAAPFLGWGPVGFVVSWILTYFADMLYDAVKMAVDLEVIVLRNEAHRKAYDAAAVKLHIIAREKGIESPEFRSARDEHKVALAKFVRFST